jgi:hypothetical protein
LVTKKWSHGTYRINSVTKIVRSGSFKIQSARVVVQSNHFQCAHNASPEKHRITLIMRTFGNIAIVASAAFMGAAAAAPLTKMVELGSAQVCSQVLDLMSPLDETTCDCEGDFSIVDGLSVDVACQSTKTVCIADNYCGAHFIYATITPKGVEDSKACLKLNLTDSEVPDLCVTAKGAGFGKNTTLKMESCGVTFGETACTCTVCESGRDFTFDCSAIEIDTPSVLLPSFTGPKTEKCIGLGLLPDIGGDGGDFRPFGSSSDGQNTTNTTVA